jgi:hypothetical protein
VTARQGLNELTIRREGSSRELTPEQDQAYLLLCAAADRLRNHDLAAVQAMHAQACALDAIQDGVPVAVTAAYELLETILRNEIVDAEGQCTCWLSAAQQAFTIRNTVSQAMLTHCVQSLADHSLVTAQTRAEIRTRFPTPGVKVTSRTVAGWDSTATVVDAAVTGGVMAAAMIQDVLAMAGMGPFPHR